MGVFPVLVCGTHAQIFPQLYVILCVILRLSVYNASYFL
jgi:hypothetical protein